MLDNLTKNWKTSILGVAAIAITAAFLIGRIDLTAYVATVGAIAGGGLLASKDGNVTGK